MHLKRDSQMRYSIVLRYSPAVESCEWVTTKQQHHEISPPPLPLWMLYMRAYGVPILMKFESYRPISFWCIKPQGFQNFPPPNFHSTIFPDRLQLDSKTERYNNILHSILKCMVMRGRRKEKSLHVLLIKYKENYGRQNFPLCSTWLQLSTILTLGLF